MPRLILQPSYGNWEAREHWERTLDHEVEFTARRYARLLSASDMQRLMDLHPSGRARFWGPPAIETPCTRRCRPGTWCCSPATTKHAPSAKSA
jgi:hypothetical protein